MNKRAVLNISLFLITAIIISLIVPSYTSFSYNFHLGQNWNGEDVVSIIDFPVEKTEEQYNEDVETQERNYIPIYEIDSLTTGLILESIALQYQERLFDNMDLSNDGTKIYNIIEQIVSIGIIDSTDNLADKSIIKLISKGKIENLGIKNLYTINQALEIIYSRLKSQNISSPKDLIIIKEVLQPNIVYNNDINQINKQKEIDKISKTKGFRSKGITLLSKGEKIDIDNLHVLNSYKNELYKSGATKFSYLSFLGYMVYVIIIMMLSYFSLKNFRPDVMTKLKNVLFLLLIYLVSITAITLINNHTALNIYIIPFIIVPIYISAFYSTQMSVHQSLFLLLIASILSPNPIEFIAINFLGGVVAIMIIKSSYRRHIIVKASLGALATFITVYTCLCMISGNFSDYLNTVLWLTINAFSIVILYQFLFIIEKSFNFITNITLFDLCDTNRPLLKELATKAPGTFQHAIQVANLCETSAKAIKANSLLARTGALYHDIGKMLNPNMFIENASAGKEAHTGLSPKQSAEIIKNHVNEGIALAKKYNLPNAVIEFIESHHANSLIYFFYRQELDALGEMNVDESTFRYPGPKPTSKEASICLICDSVEAASRSLDEYTEKSIQDMIESIISNQIKDGLLANSKLEIKDINTIKQSLKTSIMNIYHSRIAYPERD